MFTWKLWCVQMLMCVTVCLCVRACVCVLQEAGHMYMYECRCGPHLKLHG